VRGDEFSLAGARPARITVLVSLSYIVLQGESDMALTALINASERPVGKSL
jgi:hypothetical protein